MNLVIYACFFQKQVISDLLKHHKLQKHQKLCLKYWRRVNCTIYRYSVNWIFLRKLSSKFFSYGSEIWGFSNNESIERVHLKFCKILLKLKMSTPSYLIYRELGRYSMDIDINVRIISYWTRLLTGKQSKLSFLYKCMYNLSLNTD